MVIICDSREKKNGHVLNFFEKNGIEYVIQGMKVADYQIEGVDSIVVDRKQNLDELATNLMNRNDKSRFWREVRRARDRKIKMFVLCEHGAGIKSIEDVSKWNSRFSPVSGRDLMNEIYRVHISYGVEFLFCEKRHTGAEILKILTQEGKV
jgi:ERCC4-type nuclease